MGCGRLGHWFCEECQSTVRLITPPYCPRCGQPNEIGGLCPLCQIDPPRLSAIRSVSYLDGVMEKAIHALKYKRLRSIAPVLGTYLADYWRHTPLPVDIAVPVPLHPSRLRHRGYNHSALLARELSAASGLPVVEDCLLRVRATAPQVQLNARERRENVAGAFRCADERLAGLRVLLVDDVCTTSATLNACAEGLLAGGAREVWGLTLARTCSPHGSTRV